MYTTAVPSADGPRPVPSGGASLDSRSGRAGSVGCVEETSGYLQLVPIASKREGFITIFCGFGRLFALATATSCEPRTLPRCLSSHRCFSCGMEAVMISGSAGAQQPVRQTLGKHLGFLLVGVMLGAPAAARPGHADHQALLAAEAGVGRCGRRPRLWRHPLSVRPGRRQRPRTPDRDRCLQVRPASGAGESVAGGQTAAGASMPAHRFMVLSSTRPHAFRYTNNCVR